MFEDLDQKMQGEQADGRKTEMNRKHAYMMLMQDLENRLQNTKDQRERDIVEKAEKEQQLAAAQGEKANTEATLAEDEKYLAELRQMCKTKTAEFEQRQELRQGELDAIAKAAEIMSGRCARRRPRSSSSARSSGRCARRRPRSSSSAR